MLPLSEQLLSESLFAFCSQFPTSPSPYLPNKKDRITPCDVHVPVQVQVYVLILKDNMPKACCWTQFSSTLAVPLGSMG